MCIWGWTSDDLVFPLALMRKIIWTGNAFVTRSERIGKLTKTRGLSIANGLLLRGFVPAALCPCASLVALAELWIDWPFPIVSSRGY
jgi:hypothetical protein